MMAATPVYDAFHFAQLRDGGRLAVRAERAALRNMTPRLDRILDTERPDPWTV